MSNNISSDFANSDTLSDLGSAELVKRVQELEADVLMLQAVVCDLLYKNELLRLREYALE